ncbi:copper oxidase [Thermaerobacter sp. FW80]|uniref:multicopper oxidase family protein n=1 Tax=Thermaerobacter sp. FW80 TaxID=2546351 RepID=UPI001074F730|nr:copper oxidase [Thermaerobacter sp. FW80]QBS38201.1 copper oxidase [Thermaerobacter sp. FW80]
MTRGKTDRKRKAWWLLTGAVVVGLVVWAVAPQVGALGSGQAPAAPARGGASAGSGDAAGTGQTAAGHGSGSTAAPADYTIYPAGTGSEGQQPLPEGQQLAKYRVEDGVKVFELTALPVKWSVGDKEYEAWTFNGTVPGPQIRVKEGDRVRIIVKNQLPEPTVVHWHGLAVPNKMDGVPMVTQDPIPPGGRFVYEFVAKPAGTHMYHTHFNTMKQKGLGLYGTFIVEPKGPEPWKYDKEYSLMIGDGQLGYVINGKSFPHTPVIKLKLGETARFRLMNIGELVHPMHLHGADFTIIAKDGQPLPQPIKANTLDMMPGDTYDVLVNFDRPGTWVWHCHIISHVEDSHGNMLGLIQVLQVEE